MRTALLFLLALGVFVAGYFAVAWLMPAPPGIIQREINAVAPQLRQSQRIIGDVDGVTFRSHDTQTGAAVAEVRIGEYRRSSDDEVLLRSIEATILLGEGSGLVTISAPAGTVQLEAGVEEQDRITPETLGTADLARLKDVTVRWYGDAAALARGPSAALLTLRVDNLVYDNRGLSLFTDDTEIAGATVLADDVPVEVRGRDYDFDGYGLLMRWDVQTRRPALLRVARGERLTIKTQRGFMPQKIVGAGSAPALAGRRQPLQGLMLASLDRQSADRAAAQAVGSAGRQEAPEQLFRATMGRNLRAIQGGITKLEADLAMVFFAADSLSLPPDTQGPPSPSTRPATAPATREAPAQEPFAPVTLYWDGGLLIEAIEAGGDAPRLRSEHDMHLRLEGAPLVMRQEGVEARGRRLDFAKLPDELELVGDVQTPVTLVEAGGSTLVTSRLLARPSAGTARTPAAGYAEVISGQEALQLRWERECDFIFTKDSTGAQQLRSVKARGTVRVRHPEVSLDSEALDVSLAPAAKGSAGPQLESVFADGSVLCEIAGAQPTRFTSDRLRLTFDDGLDGTITALAEGKVRSHQGGQNLGADSLRVLLAPDEADGLQLIELTASGNVQGSDDDGRTYRADSLRATPMAAAGGEEAGQQFDIRLTGTSARPAVVEVAGDKLLGPVLVFNSRDEVVNVPGPGQMQTVQKGPSGRPLPLAVKWTDSMTGTRRQVDLREAVELSGREPAMADDPLLTAIRLSADSATLLLKGPAESAEATGAPQIAADPTTQPAEVARSIEKLTLTGNLRATVEEQLDDALLRSFDLRAQALDAWPGEKTARVEISSPGKVLVRDLRPPPSNQAVTRPVTEGFRGNAAVEWKQRLEFDPETGLLKLLGGVTFAVEPVEFDSAGAQRAGRTFRLDAQQAHIQTQPADGRLEMKSATAAGQARFSTEGLSFEGGRIEFDPLSHRITARGEAGSPVVVFDGDGVPTGRFVEVVYNLETGQIERLRDVGAGG